MQRYFMTIPEATQLVLQAGTMGAGGEIFILDMGEPVKVVELARDLVRLSGFRQDEIRVEFTGIRPGEKLTEQLSTDEEQADKTRHAKILVGRTQPQDLDSVRHALERLVEVAQRGETDTVRTELARVVPDYREAEAVGTPASHERSRDETAASSGTESRDKGGDAYEAPPPSVARGGRAKGTPLLVR
jgi:FlaA1/EpsC-like NDP-sugar epimerase